MALGDKVEELQRTVATLTERVDNAVKALDALDEAYRAIGRELADLRREIESLREQASKPTGNFAAQEDLKRVADAVKEVDRKRLEDYDKIRTTIKDLGATLAAQPPQRTKKSDSGTMEIAQVDKHPKSEKTAKSEKSEKGYPCYVHRRER